VESFSPRPANTGAIAVVGLAFNVGEKKIRKKKDVKADKNGMNTNGDRRRHVTGENRTNHFVLQRGQASKHGWRNEHIDTNRTIDLVDDVPSPTAEGTPNREKD